MEIPGKLIGPEADEYQAMPWHVRAGLKPKPADWIEVARRGRTVRVAAVPVTVEMGDRETCLAELHRQGAEFIRMRGPRSAFTNEARSFAHNHLRPLVIQAKSLGIATRRIAAATGYTPETVNAIWVKRRHEAA